ncbi:MAG: galactose mutarotase-like enzyme [Eubacterium sp.]|jgi:aldose 1-epimerase|nr:galactose mutarotase-like enzyme [Eubacterium sp.]
MIENCIPLSCGNWEAEVLPSFGANLIAFRYKGLPVLRTPDSIEQLNENPCLYGNPVLFPPNRTADGRFLFEKREYHLPVNEPLTGNHLHGMLYNAPFDVSEITDRSAVCLLKNKGEWFPFDFSMEISFELDGEGLTQHIAIHNDGTGSMPVLLGFHTSFVAPEDFSVSIKKRWERDLRHIPTGKLSDLSERELYFKNGCASEEQVISDYYTAEDTFARLGPVLYQVSPEFTQWVLYNGGGNKGFLCVEPQSGPVNGLNIPGGYTVLPQGKTARFWLRFTSI